MLFSFPQELEEEDNVPISLRLDGEKVSNEIFSSSSSGKAAFAPNPAELAEKMSAKKSVVVGFQLSKQKQRVVEFNLAHFPKVSERVYGKCGVEN